MPSFDEHIPHLNLKTLRRIDERIAEATHRLREALMLPPYDINTIRKILADGARFETLTLSRKNPNSVAPGYGTIDDAWQVSLDEKRLDIFEALLDADAVRKEPDAHTPSLVSRIAACGQPDFLEALLARNPPLNRRGPTPFLSFKNITQNSTGLIGALVSGDDDALDRLLAAGASPCEALEPPRYTSTPNYKLNPLSLLHLASTPHAIKRLIQAGIDPNVCDEYGRTAIGLVFDTLYNERQKNKIDPTKKQEVFDRVVALIEAGANPEICSSEPGNALSKAMINNVPDLVKWLTARGLSWPADHIPKNPLVAANALEQGVRLPLKTAGHHWWAAWIKTYSETNPEPLTRWDHALNQLAQAGFPLDDPDPETGMTPLVTTLQEGNYSAMIALISAGARTDISPGKGWDSRVTWGQLISKAINPLVYKENNAQSFPRWDKLNLKDRYEKTRKKDIILALQTLGNHPAVLAHAKSIHLEKLIDPVVVPEKTPRHRL